MAKFSSEGIITGLGDLSEADRLVSLFTPEGPMRAIAKQARWSVRRFGGRLDLFNRIAFDYSRKEPEAPAFLDETEIMERFTSIPTDHRAFGFAAVKAELIMGAWGENEPAGEPYDFFVEYLRRVNAGGVDDHRQYFEAAKLLALIGHAPSLESCAACSKPVEAKGPVAYSAIEGGAICGECAPGIKRRDERGGVPTIDVDAQTLKTFSAGMDMSYDRSGRLKFTRRGLAEARAIWFSHVRSVLGRTTPGIEYMEKIEKH